MSLFPPVPRRRGATPRPLTWLLLGPLLAACGTATAGPLMPTVASGSTTTSTTSPAGTTTTSSTAAGAVAAPGPVWILGDSLTVGAAPYLDGLLPGRSVSIDARVGRTTDQGIAIAAREAPTRPGTIMVALGTNDGASGPEFAQRIDQLMALLGTQRVLWVNVSRPGYQALNDALVSAAGRYPDLQVVDWASAIAQHPEDVAPDGIHCTEAGYRFRAGVMATALG